VGCCREFVRLETLGLRKKNWSLVTSAATLLGLLRGNEKKLCRPEEIISCVSQVWESFSGPILGSYHQETGVFGRFGTAVL
jgi:hypothetical protein